MNLLLFTGYLSTEAIITAIFIGLILATVAMFFHKYFTGKFVKKLVKEGIESPEKAKTFKELSANFLIRHAISDGNSVRRLFGYTLGEEVVDDPHAALPKKGGRKDLSEARFYLLPEKKAEATTRFPVKGNSPLVFLICIVLMVAGYFLAKHYLPALIETLVDAYANLGE